MPYVTYMSYVLCVRVYVYSYRVFFLFLRYILSTTTFCGLIRFKDRYRVFDFEFFRYVIFKLLNILLLLFRKVSDRIMMTQAVRNIICLLLKVFVWQTLKKVSRAKKNCYTP